MKFGVNKKVLLYTAGCVWIFAGINILRIGIVIQDRGSDHRFLTFLQFGL